MISSSAESAGQPASQQNGHSCRRLVAGNYDVLINEPPLSRDSFRRVLTDFLDHFERQEAELREYHKHLQLATAAVASLATNGNQNNSQQQAMASIQIPACGYVNEFKLLKELSRALKEDKSNLIEGELEQNQRKNRYKDILPFSHSRVVLGADLANTKQKHQQHHQKPQETCGDDYDKQPNARADSYINANYIRGPSGSPRAYIACQGPLACTLNDFWRMIWECNVSVIVMACNEQESGKPKCELYWPDQLDASLVYGDIQVSLMRVRQINSDFLIRKLSVKLLERQASSETYASSASSCTSSSVSPLTNPQSQPYANGVHSMDGNNNNGNNNNNCNHNGIAGSGAVAEDTYDCDSNSFKLAGVRLPASGGIGSLAPQAPGFTRHGQFQSCGPLSSSNTGPHVGASHMHRCGASGELSNGHHSSTSTDSISTSDDSTLAHAPLTTHTNHQPKNTNTPMTLNQHQQNHSQCSTRQYDFYERQYQQYQHQQGQQFPEATNRKVLAERTICQFHYTTWPDHGVPDSVQPILELVRLIREVQPAETKPVLVHCSAGCGRTGTICCIDYVWGLLRLNRLESNFNLCNIIAEMRQQRMAMVQTLEQYILCHRAVAALFLQQLQLLALDDAHRRLSGSPATTPSTNDQSSSSIEDSSKLEFETSRESDEVLDQHRNPSNHCHNDRDKGDDVDDEDEDEVINYDDEDNNHDDDDDEHDGDMGPVFI